MVIALDCSLPLRDEPLRVLEAGVPVALTGELLTLRDASAARLVAAIERGEYLPVDLRGRLMYAVGPSPARPGHVIGAPTPTTTARLVSFLPSLLEAGIKGIIGKGDLHGEIVERLVQHGAVYLATIGGLGALLTEHIVRADVVAFADLGPEAIYRFTVEGFPAIVAIDTRGHNLHETARTAWRRPGPGGERSA
jgi:fumarate hydratase subunit beta